MEQGITTQDIVTLVLMIGFFSAFLVPALFSRTKKKAQVEPPMTD